MKKLAVYLGSHADLILEKMFHKVEWFVAKLILSIMSGYNLFFMFQLGFDGWLNKSFLFILQNFPSLIIYR